MSENRTQEASFSPFKMTLPISLACTPLDGLIICWLFRLKFEWLTCSKKTELKSWCRNPVWPLSCICFDPASQGLPGNARASQSGLHPC